MEKWTPYQFVTIKEICRLAEKAGLEVRVVEEDAEGNIGFPDNDLKTYRELTQFVLKCDGIMVTPKKGGE